MATTQDDFFGVGFLPGVFGADTRPMKLSTATSTPLRGGMQTATSTPYQGMQVASGLPLMPFGLGVANPYASFGMNNPPMGPGMDFRTMTAQETPDGWRRNPNNPTPPPQSRCQGPPPSGPCTIDSAGTPGNWVCEPITGQWTCAGSHFNPPDPGNPGSGGCSESGARPKCEGGLQPVCIGGRWVCDPANSPGPYPGNTGGTPPGYGGGGGGGGSSNVTMEGNVPKDIKALRESLQAFFLRQLGQQNPSFINDQTLMQLSPMWGNMIGAMETGYGNAMGAVAGQEGRLQPGGSSASYNYGPLMDAYRQVSGIGSPINSPLAAIANQQMPTVYDPYLQNLQGQITGGAGGGTLTDISRTGGYENLSPALEAIRSRGMIDIENQLAQIRETYGGMGLGAGSDISTALARGASEGIASINQTQSTLAAQLLSEAQNRRLQAASGLTGVQQNLMNTLATMRGEDLSRQVSAAGTLSQGVNTALGTGHQIMYGDVQARQNAEQILQGLAGTHLAGGQAMAGTYGQAAAADQSVQEYNARLQYEDAIRRQMPPGMEFMIPFATNNPYTPKPVIQGGGTNWGAILGGVAGMLGPYLASLGPGAAMLSDRDTKENIEKVEELRISKGLRKLPIYRWNYKGDPIPHIGPMAQDFQKTFGVGDGHTIHLVDMMGVLLGAMKEQASHA